MQFLFFLGVAGLYGAYWLALGAGWRRERARAADAQAAATEDAPGDGPPLSVVVAARNEEAVLPTLLAALAAQTHPALEVVIVDDASTDATAAVVEAHAATAPHPVRLVRVADPQPPRKKHALTQGLAAARHPRVALTDADCAPPPGWAAALARTHAAWAAREVPEVVLVGYSPYRRRGGLLGRFARYETFAEGCWAAAAVGLGRAYMAVGRNLSYPVALFHRLGGFAHSARSMSGDDDLFVQAVRRRAAAPIRFVFDPATFVATDAPPSWRAWLHQKRRHASAGRFYARGPQVHLALFHAAGLLRWLAPAALGATGWGLLAATLLAEGAVLGRAARALGEDDLMPLFPLWSLGYTLYATVVAPLGLLRPPASWRAPA